MVSLIPEILTFVDIENIQAVVGDTKLDLDTTLIWGFIRKHEHRG